jgi:hypothetical protein
MWGPTVRSAQRLFRAVSLVLPLTAVVGLLSPATAALAVATYPSAVITSPVQNATWTGLQAVYATVATDPAGSDYPQSSALYVDGIDVSTALTNCEGNAGTKSCAEHYLWDASGKTGTHHAHVTMTTHSGATVTSADLAINVVSPPPSVTVDYPTEGASVSGPDVYVDATGTMDASQQGDYAHSMSLLVDGAVVDTQPCDLTSSTCYPEFDWATDGFSLGSHTLTVTMLTGQGNTGTSAARHVTLVDLPVAVVAITSPAANATVSGPVNVTASGSIAATYGDAPQVMALFVDDNQVGGNKTCPATGATCTLSFPWDASGLTGRHTVEVGFATVQDQVVFSGPMSVTVTSPAPTVTLTLAGDPTTLVRGITQVTLTGTIDPSQTDAARDLALYINGEPWGVAQPCALAGRTCTATFSWNTAALAGAQQLSLSGRFDTAHTIAWTPIRFVNVGVDLSTPGNSHVGVLGETVKGVDYADVVVWDKNQLPLIGVPVTVKVKPGNGPSYIVTGTTTGPYGHVLLPLLGHHVTSMLTASLGPAYGSATSSRKFIVQAIATCHLPKTVTHGHKTTIACKGSQVAPGTKVTLYFKYPHAGVHVLGHALFDAKGHATIVFVSKVRKETVQLWTEVSNSAVYAGVMTRPVLVRMI